MSAVSGGDPVRFFSKPLRYLLLLLLDPPLSESSHGSSLLQRADRLSHQRNGFPTLCDKALLSFHPSNLLDLESRWFFVAVIIYAPPFYLSSSSNVFAVSSSVINTLTKLPFNAARIPLTFSLPPDTPIRFGIFFNFRQTDR